MRRCLPRLLAVSWLILASCTTGSDGETAADPSATSSDPVLSTSLPSPTATLGPAESTGAQTTGAQTSGVPAATDDVASDAPAAIAAEITAAERLIRDASASPADIAAAGRSEQRALRLLASNPDWDAEVRSLLPSDVVDPFDRNVEARRAVTDHSAGRPPSDPPSTLPAWDIVEPASVDDLMRSYREAEAVTGVPWAYLAAINLVETRMGRIDGVSSAGAIGPMQFLPETWASCCTGDPLDPHDAILGAATYLVIRGAPADMLGALYGYNPNEGYVGAVDAYARNMLDDERAVRGYHAWEVYVSTAAGTVRLPIGYSASVPVDAADYADVHPEDVSPITD